MKDEHVYDEDQIHRIENCPKCQRDLEKIQEQAKQIQEAGAGV